MPKDYSDYIEKVGEKLKQIRVEKGYTSYRKFSDEFSIEPKQYWRLEEGKSDFKFSSLLRVLEIHRIDLEEFFKDIK